MYEQYKHGFHIRPSILTTKVFFNLFSKLNNFHFIIHFLHFVKNTFFYPNLLISHQYLTYMLRVLHTHDFSTKS